MLKTSLGNMCIFIYWGILMFGKGMGLYGSNPIYRMLTIAVIVVIFVKFFFEKYTRRDFLICACLGGIGAASFFVTSNDTVLVTILTIIAFRNIDVEQVLGWSFWIRGIPYAIRMICYIIGVIPMSGVYTEANSNVLRYTFGYTHPNLAHYELVVLFMLYYLAKKGKLSVKAYLFFAICNIGLFSYTRSKTGIICIFIIMLLNILCANNVIKSALERISLFSFIAMGTLSFVAAFAWMKILGWGVAGTFYSRFQRSYYLQKNSSINLFGQALYYQSDNGYVNIFYNYGIIIFVLFVIGNTWLIKKCVLDKKMYVVIVLICISIHFCMECYDISVLLNCSLLFFAEYIFKSQKICNRCDARALKMGNYVNEET